MRERLNTAGIAVPSGPRPDTTSPEDMSCLLRSSRSVGCAVCKSAWTARVQRGRPGEGPQCQRLRSRLTPNSASFRLLSAGFSPSQMRSSAEKNSGSLMVSPTGLPLTSTVEPTPGT